MNVLNHMEAVFVATLALAASSTFMNDSIPTANAQPLVSSGGASIAVVVVKAKRMNAEEKLKSVQAEHAHASANRA